MRTIIHPLPPDVIHLIFAGEVIDSLSAVVRELSENAIDAGATRISIALYPQEWSLRISDNGSGMNLANLQKAALAHTTSKISSTDDLWQITTLGFRGEALHSIAALAKLEIRSRLNPDLITTTDDQIGHQVIYNHQGEAIALEKIAIAPGTVVTVSQLFQTRLVKRQGLPNLSQQIKAVQNVIIDLAIANPHINWVIEQNDKSWFTISSADNPLKIIPQIIKQIHYDHLDYLTLEIPDHGRLEIVIGLPDRYHRNRLDWIKVAINHRIIRSNELEQAILSAFIKTLPKDRYPLCLIHLHLQPNQIDWNRNPAKSEIFLDNINLWSNHIKMGIEKILQNSQNISNQRTKEIIKVAEQKVGYTIKPQITKSSLLPLKVIGQINKTYIVVEHPQGLWLVEQHIAHERIIYEQICDHWEIVPLESPIIIPYLTPSQIEQLNRIQLEVEPFGDQIWLVRNAPLILAQRHDLKPTLIDLSKGSDLKDAQVAVACRSAIRNGTTLTQKEMEDIITKWQQTRNPKTCPHGRPICLQLEESSLSKFFRRHWVIGKSYGI